MRMPWWSWFLLSGTLFRVAAGETLLTAEDSPAVRVLRTESGARFGMWNEKRG